MRENGTSRSFSGTLRAMRRLLISLALLSTACTSTPSVDAFCDQAVPILSRDGLGDDPTAMQQQMDDLSTAAELLPDDQSAVLQTRIDVLNDELDLAFKAKPRTAGQMRTSSTPSAPSAVEMTS